MLGIESLLLHYHTTIIVIALLVYYISSYFSFKNHIWDKFLHPRMFVAPALSRAYPTHRHGQPEHSMLLMLQGRKHFVHWPNDAAEHLYEIKLGTQTETGDRVFMANPFTNDSSQQPDMVKAQGGYEGVVHEGELLYVPRGIHIIKNLDAVLAVGYVHQLDEKVKTWNYDDSFKRAGKHCDVSAPKYLRQVACYSLQDASNSAAEEDLRWILARLNETCDGVTSEDQCTLDD
mmetsp:Transcript_31553/g.51045  ORF Transcript_31553/g.51045 Transcript_31553/m.51045 type:complete len:232 (+) Transcript_31553:1044-1739(+)